MPHLRVNSFSVFGPNQRAYTGLLPALIRMHKVMYPGAEWRFDVYLDRPFDSGWYYTPALNQMNAEGLIRVVVVAEGPEFHRQRRKCLCMLWRMLPVWEEDVEYVFCRDADSILTPRQLYYVTDFIRSGKLVHGINDNPSHVFPLMGGMVGFRAPGVRGKLSFRSFDDILSSYHSNPGWWSSHGTDQLFLMGALWPHIQNDVLLHQIEGPNDRSGMRPNLPGVEIAGVSPRVLAEGDKFANYIGACGTSTSRGTWDVPSLCRFYDEHGGAERLGRVWHIEKQTAATPRNG